MSPGKLRAGVFLIITGVLLLLNTTGRLEWSFWVDLIWLWPMLLIALGVEKVFLAVRMRQLAYVSSLILVLTVVWAWNSHARGPRTDPANYDYDSRYSQVYPLDTNLTSLTAELDFGAGRLIINSTSDQLFDGDFYSKDRRPRVTLKKQRRRARVRVRPASRSYSVGWPQRFTNKWQVKLTDRLPVRLNIDCGASRLELNLADLQLERFELNAGASEIDLVIGTKAPRVDCYIDCGAAHLEIMIPRGAGLRVHREMVISSFNSGEIELRRRGAYHETINFEDAAVQINLDLEAGVSAFRVSYSDETVGPGSI